MAPYSSRASTEVGRQCPCLGFCACTAPQPSPEEFPRPSCAAMCSPMQPGTRLWDPQSLPRAGHRGASHFASVWAGFDLSILAPCLDPTCRPSSPPRRDDAHERPHPVRPRHMPAESWSDHGHQVTQSASVTCCGQTKTSQASCAQRHSHGLRCPESSPVTSAFLAWRWCGCAVGH